jgi:hypothetical protein
MKTTTLAVCLAAVVGTAGLAGCADPSSGSPDSFVSSGAAAAPATAASPPAASPSPSAGDSRPPKDPTDQTKNTKWVVGTVTTGGSGPCYSLLTDDGTAYALHSADGAKLVKGVRMRVKTETARVRIHCGPGKLVEMTAAEPVS